MHICTCMHKYWTNIHIHIYICIHTRIRTYIHEYSLPRTSCAFEATCDDVQAAQGPTEFRRQTRVWIRLFSSMLLTFLDSGLLLHYHEAQKVYTFSGGYSRAEGSAPWNHPLKYDYLESQWPVICGCFVSISWASLGYSGRLFWATWLSRYTPNKHGSGERPLVRLLSFTRGPFRAFMFIWERVVL